MITIDTLNPNRWSEYKALRLEALQSDPLALLSSYEEEVNLPDEKWQERVKGPKLFAQDNGKLVGMIAYYTGTHLKDKHVATIWGVYVKAQYRGQKIGKKLLSRLLDELNSNPHITKIKLGVNPIQTAAYNLYTSYGFKEIGTFKNELLVDGKYYDEVFMEIIK